MFGVIDRLIFSLFIKQNAVEQHVATKSLWGRTRPPIGLYDKAPVWNATGNYILYTVLSGKGNYGLVLNYLFSKPKVPVHSPASQISGLGMKFFSLVEKC